MNSGTDDYACQRDGRDLERAARRALADEPGIVLLDFQEQLMSADTDADRWQLCAEWLEVELECYAWAHGLVTQ